MEGEWTEFEDRSDPDPIDEAEWLADQELDNEEAAIERAFSEGW
tara:strand:- start:524 stop:655 length:132 start_codon:yes stop_codon:yes gene_type:complete